MDRLPEPLSTFKDFVEADLRRGARLIIRVQDELDPQFRIATPEGDYHLAVTLAADLYERRSMLRRVAAFMAWKQAVSFILASELGVPDCVYAVGVSHKEVHSCLARIAREPRPWTKANFGAVEWLERAQVDPELIGLLPRGAQSIDATQLAMLDKWFGPRGKFPALHLPSGELREL